MLIVVITGGDGLFKTHNEQNVSLSTLWLTPLGHIAQHVSIHWLILAPILQFLQLCVRWKQWQRGILPLKKVNQLAAQTPQMLTEMANILQILSRWLLGLDLYAHLRARVAICACVWWIERERETCLRETCIYCNLMSICHLLIYPQRFRSDHIYLSHPLLFTLCLVF